MPFCISLADDGVKYPPIGAVGLTEPEAVSKFPDQKIKICKIIFKSIWAS